MSDYYAQIESIKKNGEGFDLNVSIYRSTMCCDEHECDKTIYYENVEKFDPIKCAVLLGFKKYRG